MGNVVSDPPPGNTDPKWLAWFKAIREVCFAQTQSGTTANRPTKNLWLGRRYWDTTLTQPVFLSSASPATWVTWPTSSGATWTMVSKTSDESRTSTTTPADDSTLKFPVAANTKYRFRGMAAMVFAVGPGFQYTFNGPVLASGKVTMLDYSNAGGVIVQAVRTAYGTNVSGGTGTTSCYVQFQGLIQNDLNSGNFTFKWAQGSSNVSPTTVQAGSFIEWMQV